jgi:hypothetical protein
MPFFYSTVSALVDALIPVPGGREQYRETRCKVFDFVIRQYRRTPNHLRLGLFAAALLLGLWPIPRFRSSFRALSEAQQLVIVDRWRRGGLLMRALILYFETLSVFAWYSYHEH